MARIFAEDAGKAVLRVSVGVMLLLHGIFKLHGGMEEVQGYLDDKDLPAFLAYGVLIGEVVAPLFVIAGYRARFAALLMAGNMVVAVALAYPELVFRLDEYGGWAIELAALYFFGSLAISFLGAGRYSLSRGRTRWD
jgi:putative oxidoreductase